LHFHISTGVCGKLPEALARADSNHVACGGWLELGNVRRLVHFDVAPCVGAPASHGTRRAPLHAARQSGINGMKPELRIDKHVIEHRRLYHDRWRLGSWKNSHASAKYGGENSAKEDVLIIGIPVCIVVHLFIIFTPDSATAFWSATYSFLFTF